MTKNLRFSNIALLFSLYTTQFLGLGFFTEAFVGILRQNGVPLENLGLVYMLGLFWVLRFLWAPIIDRFAIKALGHYRAWIILFQFFMVLSLFLSSFFDIMKNLSIVISLSVLFAFFSASQNIALDALVFKTVSLKHRPLANSLKSAGGMIGMILGGGVGLVIYSNFGWDFTMTALSILTVIAFFQILFYKEPKKEKGLEFEINYKQYLHFWKGRRRRFWFFFIVIYPVTISSAFGLITPMLVDAGWGLDKIGFYVHILGYSIGVFSSFLASWLIGKFGKKNILIFAGIGQIIGILSLLLIVNGFHNEILVMLIIGVIFSFYTPSSVVMTTLMMDESSEKSPAAQFAIQHSLYMFATIIFAGSSVSLSGPFGYQNVILCVSIIGILAVYASMKIEIKKEIK